MRERSLHRILRFPAAVASVSGLGLISSCGLPPDQPAPEDVITLRSALEPCTPTIPPPKPCPVRLWPNGRIKYSFAAGVPSEEKTAVLAAMNKWSAVTRNRLTFQEDLIDLGRFVINPDPSNAVSPIGMG